MAEAVSNDIVLLVERLLEEKELESYEVEVRLAAYPGWSQWVNLMLMDGKHYGASTVTLITGTQFGVPGLLPPGAREALLNMLQPYALLLDERHTPAKRAELLEQADIDVDRFCNECFQNENQEIVAAAYVVLATYEAKQDLLRASARPQDSPQELLRPPSSGQINADSLLRAAEAVKTISRRTNWFQRLWNRIFGKKQPPG